MGCAIVPDEREPVEIMPMDFRHVTSIASIGTVDGRAYVTLIEDQPGDRPGRTVPVVAAKLMVGVENLPSIIAELQAAYDQWAALHNHRRKQN